MTACRIQSVMPAVCSLFFFVSAASAEKIVLVAGGGSAVDQPGAAVRATEARLDAPFAVELDQAGNMYLAEYTGQRIKKVDPKGMLTTIAGTGEKGFAGDDGPATSAQFNNIHGLAIGPQNEIYVADTVNRRVRRIDPASGRITTVIGTGDKRNFSGDGGPAAKAEFGAMYCAALDPKRERLYLADLDNRRIRVVDLKSGIVTTVAGNGLKGVAADGDEAARSPLVDPRAVAADASGNVWILERNGHALRVVDRQGKLRTVAGTGVAGFGGDGGEAIKAMLRGPKHLCIDPNGDVIIADTDNNVIRKYEPRTGKIVRVAGSGQKGTGGLGGDPKEAELNLPHGVCFDAKGALYIADSFNHRVLKIEP